MSDGPPSDSERGATTPIRWPLCRGLARLTLWKSRACSLKKPCLRR